jgi:hypothetical protein
VMEASVSMSQEASIVTVQMAIGLMSGHASVWVRHRLMSVNISSTSSINYIIRIQHIAIFHTCIKDHEQSL